MKMMNDDPIAANAEDIKVEVVVSPPAIDLPAALNAAAHFAYRTSSVAVFTRGDFCYRVWYDSGLNASAGTRRNLLTQEIQLLPRDGNRWGTFVPLE